MRSSLRPNNAAQDLLQELVMLCKDGHHCISPWPAAVFKRQLTVPAHPSVPMVHLFTLGYTFPYSCLSDCVISLASCLHCTSARDAGCAHVFWGHYASGDHEYAKALLSSLTKIWFSYLTKILLMPYEAYTNPSCTSSQVEALQSGADSVLLHVGVRAAERAAAGCNCKGS